jgi:hypothetical protein
VGGRSTGSGSACSFDGRGASLRIVSQSALCASSNDQIGAAALAAQVVQGADGGGPARRSDCRAHGAPERANQVRAPGARAWHEGGADQGPPGGVQEGDDEACLAGRPPERAVAALAPRVPAAHPHAGGRAQALWAHQAGGRRQRQVPLGRCVRGPWTRGSRAGRARAGAYESHRGAQGAQRRHLQQRGELSTVGQHERSVLRQARRVGAPRQRWQLLGDQASRDSGRRLSK